MTKNIVNFDTSLLHERLDGLLAHAKKQGATAAEAEIGISNGLSLTVRLGEIETIEHQSNQQVVITVYFDQRTGSASCTDFSENSLALAAEKACKIAQFTALDEFAGLADANLMAINYPELDLYYPWQLTPEQGTELVLELEQVSRDQDSRITNSEGASLETTESCFIYGNSHGFRGSYPSSRHSLSCSLIAGRGQDMQRDYDYTVARDPNQLDNIKALAQRAARRTVRRLDAQKISTRRCPVIFSADVARSLWGHLLGAISGGALYRQTSFLLNKLHKRIATERLNIQECPHLLKGLGSAPFDNEGVATYGKDLVKNGVLQSYLLDSYSARKLGMQSTANAGGAHNIIIKTDYYDFEGLLALMDKGLLVTELMGQGVNLLTGDYSRGAFGFWIENGKIQYPVQEITIAGNLAEMFLQIQAIGQDIDLRGNIQTGSVLIENMMIAGH